LHRCNQTIGRRYLSRRKLIQHLPKFDQQFDFALSGFCLVNRNVLVLMLRYSVLCGTGPARVTE
jgi:hypothetical protein